MPDMRIAPLRRPGHAPRHGKEAATDRHARVAVAVHAGSPAFIELRLPAQRYMN